MARLIALFCLVFFLIFFLLPYIYLFSPAKDYIYRELCYYTVVNNVKRKSLNFNDFLEKLTNYVYINTNTGEPLVIDDNSWNVLRRGYGLCDQQTWLLSTLLAKLGIPGRWVRLKSQEYNMSHSVAEVFVEGKWRIVDPHINRVFERDGELATYEDIVNLDIEDNGFSALLYKSFYRKEGIRWGALTEKQNKLGQAIFFPVYVQYKIFGNRFTYFYQGLGGGKWKERDRFLCS